MTAQKSVFYNDYQQQALSALGLHLWQPLHKAETEKAFADFCYRLDRWLLLSHIRIEVQHTSWQNDVVALLVELTQLSRAALVEMPVSTADNWNHSYLLDLRSPADSMGNSAHLKQIVWQQISHSLNP